jgi:glycosyltransferase involved in cell wall biosynthesis
VFNEGANLGKLLEELFGVLSVCQTHDFEVIVIDDGSTDGSGNVATEMGAKVLRHPINIGNGAAIKRGIRASQGEWILLMDGDGQHPPQEIPKMLDLAQEYDMVVGSRDGSGGAFHRNLANRIYNSLASYVTHRRIPDLTSGFRLVRADALKSFVHLLPNTFSYPTTITLAMFRAGYAVHYLPFRVRRRRGHSKIHIFADGSRFFLIILKVATFFAPLRVFLPLSAFVALLGVVWYLVTWWTTHRFTNMAVLLLVQSSVLFSLGLISEQIAQMRFDRPFPFSSHEPKENPENRKRREGG